MKKITASVAVLFTSLAGCPGASVDDAPTSRVQVLPPYCAADSGVADAAVDRPAIELVPKSVKLWPPNHKLHEIRVEDCVEIVGACPSDELEPHFVWASSDEPVDAIGDGHHEPDILVSANCQQVSLRSERQGPKDGRVYALGLRLVDASGAVHEATCDVSVDHDQRGQDATAGADAYRLDFDGTHADLPDCRDTEGDPELK